MSQVVETANIALVPLDLLNLRRLAASETADLQAAAGALPPAHVATRALSQLDSGVPANWCVPLLIVAVGSGEILGGCTFKGEPVDGRVEILEGLADGDSVVARARAFLREGDAVEARPAAARAWTATEQR